LTIQGRLLQNASKHAGDSATVTMTLADRNGLEFVVDETGAGCHPDAILTGHRFTNTRDRLDAIGGTLTVQAQPGAGSISRAGRNHGQDRWRAGRWTTGSPAY
jgi:glucose-6-phosphate-specific signal transduction histidine kinase